MLVWARLLEAIERHGRAAMVTVAATRGSAPRDAGARLIVHPDGAFTGTIGGGTLEWRAIALAQAALARPSPKRAELRNFVLGPDMGQCCGGQVELLFEVIGEEERTLVAGFAAREAAGAFATSGRISDAGVRREATDAPVAPGTATLHRGVLSEGFGEDRRPLLLFGAGHVGRALVLALAPLPFAVSWIDPRPDAFPAHVPANVTISQPSDPVSAFGDARPASFVLVMSYSHQLDLALVHAALADERFPYVGLIGSKSKRARFVRRLADAGVSADRIAGLVCPIGVAGIRSKVPAVIAAATTAELLIRDEALRARAPSVGFADSSPVTRGSTRVADSSPAERGRGTARSAVEGAPAMQGGELAKRGG
jgi:xanthine dehydrogenase accessory factor